MMCRFLSSEESSLSNVLSKTFQYPESQKVLISRKPEIFSIEKDIRTAVLQKFH